MIKKCLTLICLIGLSQQQFAQTKEKNRAEVLLAVNDYIDAFYKGDTIKLKRSMLKDVVKYGYFRARGTKKYNGEPMTYKQMIDYATKVKSRPIPDSAPRNVQILDVQNQTAAAKLTAWWGTDYVLLGKYNKKWMIVQVLWQSRPLKK